MQQPAVTSSMYARFEGKDAYVGGSEKERQSMTLRWTMYEEAIFIAQNVTQSVL
jgi:hypothetical protein